MKKKIAGEKDERIARMERDLKKWAEEDRVTAEAAAAAKKD